MTFDPFTLFPFHVQFDRNLDVLAVGPGLQKILSHDARGMNLTELLRVKRPTGISTFADFEGAAEQLIVAELKAGSVLLRGQVVLLEAGERAALLCSLWFTELSMLERCGLSFADFPFHDGTGDYLLLLQTQATALADAAEFARELSAQRAALEAMNEQLSTARKAAELASRAKSQFLANMSHEIRTPMNGVLGMLALLLDDELTEDQRRHASMAHVSASALLTVINDILDFSKIEAGALRLVTESLDIKQLVTEVFSLVADEALKTAVELNASVDSGLPPLRGDATRVRQVLLNLVGNAVKFARGGTVGVKVRSTGEDPQGLLVRIEVSDTGIGIAADVLDTLFAPFTQADGSTTRRYGGTGLGLAIAKQLTELMGGTIDVQSQLGRGSTFSFTLRLERDQLAVPLASQPVGRIDGSPRRARGRVLVAEDNPVNQEVTRAILTKLGWTVDVVADGLAALTATKNNDYDVVLMDCHMPTLDGLAATRRIREVESVGDRLPIIALTASAMIGDREQCLSAGMDGYLSKPFSPSDLLTALAPYVHTSQPPPSVRHAAPQDTIRATLAELAGELGNSVINSMIAAYLEDAPITLRHLVAACEVVDLLEIQRRSHALRSASATMGARALSSACAGMESAAARRVFERENLHRIQLEAQHAIVELRMLAEFYGRQPSSLNPVPNSMTSSRTQARSSQDPRL